MSEFITSNGITIKINEDGSITQTGSWDYNIGKSSIYSSRPQIAKMHLSSEHLTCGETVQVSWNIIDGKNNTLTIIQGGYETTYKVPDVGEMKISSDIMSDDIYIVLESRNDYGEVQTCKTLNVSKRKNDIKASTASSVVYVIIFILVFIVLISRIFDIFI